MVDQPESAPLELQGRHGRIGGDICTAVTFELDAATLRRLAEDDRVRHADPAFPTDNEKAAVRWKLWDLVGKHIDAIKYAPPPPLDELIAAAAGRPPRARPRLAR